MEILRWEYTSEVQLGQKFLRIMSNPSRSFGMPERYLIPTLDRKISRNEGSQESSDLRLMETPKGSREEFKTCEGLGVR